MELRIIDNTQINALWELQKAYKAEIGEDEPGERELSRLKKAIEEDLILFFGAFKEEKLIGCCSVTAGFSTFNYEKSGVFEDFYIRPSYRHKGIARKLVNYAYDESGISSMTVGCADCDKKMYKALGFKIELGNMLAFDK